MKKQKWRVLLLVLIVILLTIVSSRVSPKLPDAENPAVSVPDSSPSVSESPAPQQPADPLESEDPAQSPVPSEEPKIDLPDVSIHEWNLKLVNNNNVLSNGFAPDVSEIGDGQYFDSRAVDALYALLDGAKASGYNTYVSTAYRPYSAQAYAFFGKASQIAWGGEVEYAEAEIMARELVAYPGTSEHQLGLAVDIVDSSSTSLVAEEIEDLPVLLWLQEHCHEYGFILRYPKGKEFITGYNYESWHYRYVGIEVAAEIKNLGITYDEYYAYYIENK